MDAAPSGPLGWRPLCTLDGSWTLAHPEHGECCHSSAGAWTQALERYALPCGLAQHAGPRLELLDIGTGLGLNLAAALSVCAPRGLALDVLSLEREPARLRAWLDWADALPGGPAPQGERWYAQVRRALRAALDAPPGTAQPLGARAEHGRLRLVLGDARATLPALTAEARAREQRSDAHADARWDAVFLDPFSPRREPELWQPEFLAEIARGMAPQGWLSTYSAAFAVRLALARAGLRVGQGPAVGAKAEGTLASPAGAPPPLPERVRTRLEQALATGGLRPQAPESL